MNNYIRLTTNTTVSVFVENNAIQQPGCNTNLMVKDGIALGIFKICVNIVPFIIIPNYGYL